MGKRGPRPKPAALKALLGNPGKRKLKEGPKPPAAGTPAPPTWLNALAKTKWRSLAKKLAALGLLSVLDLDALAMYCQTYSAWRECEDWVLKNGKVTEIFDKDGKLKSSRPAAHAILALKYAADLRRLAAEFGLTPSSRSGLPDSGKPAGSKLSVFLGDRSE